MRVDTADDITDVFEKPSQRERKGIDRTLHPLEKVHAHQVNQALFAVDLFENRSARHLHVIFSAVFLKFVREDIFQWGV